MSQAPNPSPRSRRAAAGLVLDGAFHLYGGFGVAGTVRPDDVGGDLWRYLDGWQLLAQGPVAARYPSLAPDGHGFYLFGGCTWEDGRMGFSDRVYRFESGEWAAIQAGPGPEGRYTSLVALSGGRLIVFGGHSQDQQRKQFYGDLWALDIGSGAWERILGPEAGPGPRYGFGWTATGHEAWLFGGYDGERDRGDLWRLDLDALAWQCLADEGGGPVSRYCPALGKAGGALALFGGRSKVRPRDNFSDTWIFDGGWREWPGQGPGYHAKSAYASDGGGLWIFGGEGPEGHVSDLWRFDGENWQRIHGCRDDDPKLW